MLTEKEQATLERLEQERERRRNEKIESGAAVRVLLPIVAGTLASADAASARKRKLEELRRNGETREVFFEEITIITGVPRPGREPADYTPPAVPEPPALPIFSKRGAVSPVLPEDTPEKTPPVAEEQIQIPPRRIWATVERPSERSPGGVIAEAVYRVEGGSVKVEDLDGRLLGTAPIKPGDDIEAAARTILREKKKVSAFYDPIPYPKHSVH
jgi:hypothetical protein